MEDSNNATYEEFLEWKKATKNPPLRQLPVQPHPIKPRTSQPIPLHPQQPVLMYEEQTPRKAPKKKGKFKRWFFKGRIEKKEAKEKIIETLSNEYDEDKILKVGDIKK